MTHLWVSVHLNDSIVDERLLAVVDEVWLGEAPDAAVAFPGGDFRVRRLGNRLQVQGRWLNPGRQVRLRRGAVEVGLEAVVARPMSRHEDWLPDIRLFLATAALVLIGAWWETAVGFVDNNPAAAAQVQAIIAEVPLAAGMLSDPDALDAPWEPPEHPAFPAQSAWPPAASFEP